MLLLLDQIKHSIHKWSTQELKFEDILSKNVTQQQYALISKVFVFDVNDRCTNYVSLIAKNSMSITTTFDIIAIRIIYHVH